MEGEAVNFALDKLNALLNLGLELYNVSDEVKQIQLALRMIHCFLQDANSKRNTNSAVKQWVNEVRDVAYRIEDAIDTFLVDIEGNRPRNFGVCSKLVRPVKKPLKVKKLVDEIKAIRSTLETISKLRIQLGITDASCSSPQFDKKLFRPARPSDVDDSNVVGLDNDETKIMDQLLNRNISRRAVISIVGMGGLGKTTLAQKIYKSNKLAGHFEYRIWLSISQKFDVQKLLKEILYSVKPDSRNINPAIRQEDLTTLLEESLTQKGYLIVLDDVWTIGLWESLRIALPDGNNGSRVLITTRILDVARAADGELRPYELCHLDEDDCLTLLFQKAISIKDPRHQHYRIVLNEVAKKLMEKCGRLPLALIVLGSILSRRERTSDAWQRVHDTLDWHDEKAKRCSEVLLLSYVDLPSYLKPCFLYFASFPEDHWISAKHVMRMWIAEGFIPRGRHGTMEERAQDFLEELVQRCLVQATKKTWSGKCKTCAVHDLVRDMAIHEAREENFFTVFTKEDDNILLYGQKVRRATLQLCSPPINFDIHKNARSLLCFQWYEYELNNRRFRLLKVLSFENLDLHKIIHLRYLGSTHLRYLSFRYCKLPFEFLSISFSYLKNLETVDFEGTTFDGPAKICNKLNNLWQGSTLLHSLWKISSLRNVNFGMMPGNRLPLPSKGDHLENLQTLKINVPTPRINVKKRWQHLKALLKRTEQLSSLTIKAFDHIPLLSEGPEDAPCHIPLLSEGTRGLSCHETIQNIVLFGKWRRDLCVLNLEMLPINLTKITLALSNLEVDPMPILENLQRLTILRLLEGSFVGGELTCTRGGFPSLQKLQLRTLQNVRHWDIQEGAMPRLTYLYVFGLKLQALPQLQNVPTLQKLEVDRRLYREAKQEENHNIIQHIPSVCELKTLFD